MINIQQIIERQNSKLISIRPEDSLHTAAALLRTKKIGAMTVCDTDGALIGILSERDIVKAFANSSSDFLNMRVRDVMTSKVVTCSVDDNVNQVLEVMKDNHIRHLPVMNSGKLSGMISIRDILDLKLTSTEMEVNVLRDRVMATGFNS